MQRIGGADRFATAALLSEALDAGMSMSTTWLATGLNWPDALTGGAAAGGAGDALLLVHGLDLDESPAARDALRERIDDVGIVRLLGGTAAISAGVEAQVAALLAERSPDDDGGLPFPSLLGLVALPVAALFGRSRRRR